MYKGEKPAIDYGLSVSRLGGAVQSEALSKLGSKVRRELLSYLDVRDIYELSDTSEMNKNLQESINRGNKIIESLKQYRYSPKSEEEMINTFNFVEK